MRQVTALFVCVVVCSVVAGSASAGGSIKGAPTLAFGKQTFGNTDSVAPVGCDKNDYWLVPLIAGDHLTIKFENSSPGVGTSDVQIWKPGTDDFNVEKTDPTGGAGISSNNHGQFDFDAPSTGTYPLAFYADNCSNEAGAYDFTAIVAHKARLAPEANTLRVRGTYVIAAHYPDGRPIPSGLGVTLYGQWTGQWHKLGQAAVSNGVLRIPYSLPAGLRGGHLKLRLAAGGPSFVGFKSTVNVTVS